MKTNSSTSVRFPSDELARAIELLGASKEIVITTHYRPDGDAMGSSLGLYNYLLKKGKKVTVVTPGDYPDFLHWLPGNREVVNFEADPTNAGSLISRADLIFCLDFNWLRRVEEMENLIRDSKANRILIDHHLDPESAFNVYFSYPDACSTCELIYDFIAAMNDSALVDKSIATCIYCGIMTDTNSFRFASMKAHTHRIVALLMEAGAENFRIHENVYDNFSADRMRLTGYSLHEKLIVLKEFNTAYIALTEDELNRFNFKSGDTEGLVNYALGIKGIKLAAFFSERDGTIKISFRSKEDFSVQELSSRHFGGGGHRNASGGYSNESMEATIKKFVGLLPQYKSGLTS